MYLNFYHFRKEPFQITPDPEFLFLSPSHKEAMASIIYGIEGKKGFVAITGNVGVGKTTILRSYLDKVDKKQLKIIYIFNANVSFSSLLKTIFQDMGIVPQTDDVFMMVNQLHQTLIDEYRKGFNIVLVVDEAQNMPLETLENMRMLSNLETATEKLLQIVMIGQPEFEELLNHNELRPLKQRIAIKATIYPLSSEESLKYIEHRISKVALRNEAIFTRGALREIVKYSKGIPRVINVLCDNALVTGYGYQKRPVTAAIVKEIIDGFHEKSEKREKEYIFRWKTAAAILIIGIGAVSFLISPYRDQAWQEAQEQMHNPVKEDVTPSVTTPARASKSVINRQVKPISTKVESKTLTEKNVLHAEAKVAHPAYLAMTDKKPSQDRFRMIRKGDTLSKLIADKYGVCDDILLQNVKNHNPNIKDANKIYIGDKIVIPEPGENNYAMQQK